MSYIFLNRYCTVTANLPKTGLITLTGWITQADEYSILLLDENYNTTPILKEQLVGSILVMLEQKPEPIRRIIEEKEICEVKQLSFQSIEKHLHLSA